MTMSQSTWLHRLSRRTLGRGRRASVQVGLHRSATHWVAARLRLDPGAGPSVEQFETVAVGSPREQEAIRQLARTGVLRNAPVVLVLGAEQYNTFPLPAPSVPDAELREALRWQLRAVLPYGPEDAIIEFIRLTGADDSSAPRGLLAVAAMRRTVAQALVPLQDAGIDVLAVDIPEMAQRNVLAQLPGSGSGNALLSLDGSTGLLTVLNQGELCFARRIQMPRSSGAADEDPEHVADRIATQVQRSLEVVERQSGLAPIRTVWIGPHPDSALIARCTAEHTGMECPQLDLQAELKFDSATPDLTTEAASGALIAIGAGLRDEEPQHASRALRDRTGLAWLARLRTAA
jgi:MSHA biogenesis protein MshI